MKPRRGARTITVTVTDWPEWDAIPNVRDVYSAAIFQDALMDGTMAEFRRHHAERVSSEIGRIIETEFKVKR